MSIKYIFDFSDTLCMVPGAAGKRCGKIGCFIERSGIMRTIKRMIVAWAALWIMILPGFICAGAVGEQVLWATVNEMNAEFYLPQEGEVSACQVGTTPCDILQSKPVSELDVPIKTLILLDNSLSIPKEERPIIAQLLNNLIGNRMDGEQFTIATIEDDIHYLCTDESDYLALGSAINSITYQNQDTQLTDNLYKAIQSLYESSPLQLSRVIVIADGVDDKEIGYTREELQELIRDCGYPIYTVGCGGDSTAERKSMLENLFALSRITEGQSFYFGDMTDTYAIAQGICEYNQAQQVIVSLPKEVCDGTVHAIKIVCDGVEYTAQLTMPFGEAVAQSESEPEVEPEPAPAPALQPESEKENGWLFLVVAVGAVAAVAAIVAVVVVMKKSKKKPAEDPIKPAKSESEIVEIRDETVPKIKHWYDDLDTNQEDKTVSVGQDDNKTVQVFGNTDVKKKRKMIKLTDVNDAFRTYEVPLEGKVTVGRAGSCRIMLESSSVSREQCEIFEQNGQIYVVNRSQTNITLVDQAEAQTATLLSNGSVLTMGNVKMKVEIS